MHSLEESSQEVHPQNMYQQHLLVRIPSDLFSDRFWKEDCAYFGCLASLPNILQGLILFCSSLRRVRIDLTDILLLCTKTTMAFMKAMKAKKGSKRSIVARGRGAKARVFAGSKEKTSSGLQKSGLKKNKFGKVVSKAASAHSKKLFVKNGLQAWSDAVKGARKQLGFTGFVAIRGKSAKGKALYAKAKVFPPVHSDMEGPKGHRKLDRSNPSSCDHKLVARRSGKFHIRSDS